MTTELPKLQLLWGDTGLQWRGPTKSCPRQGSGGGVSFGVCSVGKPAIHVNVTLTCTTDQDIVADQAPPFLKTVFPGGFGLFQQENAPSLMAKMV